MKWMTPEGFTFELPLAELPTRSLAWVVDACVMAAALHVISEIVSPFESWWPGLASATGVIAGFLALLLYAAALEWFWRGQTVGKRLFGLRVMDQHGLPLSGSQVLIRNLLRVVDILPVLYLVGGLSALASARHQRLGDRVAGTVVAARRGEPAPATSAHQELKYNTFREYPAQAARLRQATTPAEAAVLTEALRRRDHLAPERRALLYQSLVEHFQAKANFPAEALAALSPEQYLRNVAGIVF